jgi:uncharacterized protein (TIGR03437 family)
MKFDHKSTLSVAALCLMSTPMLSASARLSLSTNIVGTVNIAPGTNGSQTVQANNVGDGALNLTVGASATWLSATVGAAGSCAGNCYSINIALNTAALAPGTYTEYITLSDPNAIDTPQDIAVTVNTAAGVPPAITAFMMPYGSTASGKIFPIYTSGTGAVGTVTTQSGGSWLQLLKDAPFDVQVEPLIGQSPGTYYGQVVISGSSVASDNQTIAVTQVITTAPILFLNNSSTIRMKSYPNGAAQNFAVTFANAGLGTLNIASASGSSAFLTATVTSSGSISVVVNPAGLAPGIYTGSVTLTSNAANNAQVSVPVEMVVYAVGQPLIYTGGIVNVANGASESVAQGDIVAIYGDQLSAVGTNAVNLTAPLATTLGNTQVLVNNVPAPLFFVSPGQINFQVPYTLPLGGLTTVQVVTNGTAGNTRSLGVNALTPRILYFVSFVPGTMGVIVNSLDGSLTLPAGTNVPGYATHPAKPGDVVTIYAIGLGQTTSAATAGMPASTFPLQTVANVVATFGGLFFGRPTVSLFTGLTPTMVGLYQINVKVPADTPLGPLVPVTIAVNGVETNTVNLAISASGN